MIRISTTSAGRVPRSVSSVAFVFKLFAVNFIMGEFAKAAEDYQKSAAMDDKFVFSHIQLAVAQYKLGNIANSMATFRRTLKAFPSRSEPQNY